MATVYLNKAVLLFQMRQHQAALKIMFAVMKHIDKLGWFSNLDSLMAVVNGRERVSDGTYIKLSSFQ